MILFTVFAFSNWITFELIKYTNWIKKKKKEVEESKLKWPANAPRKVNCEQTLNTLSIYVIRPLEVLEYKADFMLFFLPKMVATSTNLFINGCSLHGSHQIIIFEAKNSDKSRDGFVTGLSCFEWKNGISDGWVCE